MIRQKFAFETTGLIKGAKPGEVGSQEYLDNMKAKQNRIKTNGNEYKSFMNSMTREEQNVFANWLDANPQFVLRDANVADFNVEKMKSQFKMEKGLDKYKSYAQVQLGGNIVTDAQRENKKGINDTSDPNYKSETKSILEEKKQESDKAQVKQAANNVVGKNGKLLTPFESYINGELQMMQLSDRVGSKTVAVTPGSVTEKGSQKTLGMEQQFGVKGTSVLTNKEVNPDQDIYDRTAKAIEEMEMAKARSIKAQNEASALISMGINNK
jgi:hypothetical protein